MTLLPNYYFTFVDVMEFKDLTNEVVTSLATSQFHLDIVSLVGRLELIKRNAGKITVWTIVSKLHV